MYWYRDSKSEIFSIRISADMYNYTAWYIQKTLNKYMPSFTDPLR